MAILSTIYPLVRRRRRLILCSVLATKTRQVPTENNIKRKNISKLDGTASKGCSIASADQVVRFTRPSDSVFAYCKQSKTGAREGLGMRLEPNSLIFFLSSLPPPLTSPGSNSTVTPGLRTAGVVFSSVGIPILLLLVLISCMLCFSRPRMQFTMQKKLTEPREYRQETKGWCGISHISGYSGTSIL